MQNKPITSSTACLRAACLENDKVLFEKELEMIR
jgi:hypothetical protein